MINFRAFITVTLILMFALCNHVAFADEQANECSQEYYQLMNELTDKIRLIEAERQKLAFKPKLINDPNIDVRLTYKDGRKMRYLENLVTKLKEKNQELLKEISEADDSSDDNIVDDDTVDIEDKSQESKSDNTKDLMKQIAFLEEENKRLRNAVSKQSEKDTAPLTMNGMVCKPIKK